MKKILPVLVIAFTLKAILINAQTIPNSGFENLNANGILRNWGNVYLLAERIDSTGTSRLDSIVYNGQYYYAPINDAHSGTKALELSNSWDFTTNTGTAGAVGADDDSVFSAWGLLNLVPVGNTKGNYFRPLNFAFYYKYLPVNGDSAYAQVAMWDSLGNQIGEGSVIIANAANNYTSIAVPISYTSPDIVAFYSLIFSTFYSQSPGSHQPGFGTRFLIDDVTFNNAGSTAINPVNGDAQLTIYPNPANNVLNIASESGAEIQFYIYNISGQPVVTGSISSPQTVVSLNDVDAGFYNIVFITVGKKENHRFIVKK